MPMKKLSWVLDRLPGVRPRLVSVAIKNGAVPGAMDDMHFLHGDLGPSMLVGPDAARLIIAAYRRGELSMEAGVHPEEAPPADQYLVDEIKLRAEASKHRAAREGVDPFTDWRAMEEAFRRAGHPVPDELDVSGARVHRMTGGERDPRPDRIRFEWTDPEGNAWMIGRRDGAHRRDET